MMDTLLPALFTMTALEIRTDSSPIRDLRSQEKYEPEEENTDWLRTHDQRFYNSLDKATEIRSLNIDPPAVLSHEIVVDPK